MDIEDDFKGITGGLIHDFLVCPRSAWYSFRHIRMENELIILGKILHEKSYKGEIKNIFGENVALDFIKNERGELWVYEVKKSSKIIDAARWQLKFYLFYLKRRGVEAKGKLVVPKEKYAEEVILSSEDEIELINIIKKLKRIVSREKPPKAVWKGICEKCSYFEICWV